MQYKKQFIVGKPFVLYFGIGTMKANESL